MLRTPKNEQEVVYLFARNHERFGFTEITRFDPNGFPDCYGIKNGKEYGIEIENNLSKFFRHYFEQRFVPKTSYEYRITKNIIQIFHIETPDIIDAEYDSNIYEIWDEKAFPISPSNWITHFNSSLGIPLVVKKKSLADKVQFIVCWKADIQLNDDIEVIELSTMDL